MTPDEMVKRRFSGYQLNLITLDETGPAYAYAEPNPQVVRPEPEWWGRKDLWMNFPFDPYVLDTMRYPVI